MKRCLYFTVNMLLLYLDSLFSDDTLLSASKFNLNIVQVLCFMKVMLINAVLWLHVSELCWILTVNLVLKSQMYF